MTAYDTKKYHGSLFYTEIIFEESVISTCKKEPANKYGNISSNYSKIDSVVRRAYVFSSKLFYIYSMKVLIQLKDIKGFLLG